jgi:hypothetical protein
MRDVTPNGGIDFFGGGMGFDGTQVIKDGGSLPR